MHDDLDAQLLRRFATAARPLDDAGFSARVEQQLRGRTRLALGRDTFYSLAGAVLGGLGSALVTPWRQRHTRLMAVGAAAVSLWAMLL